MHFMDKKKKMKPLFEEENDYLSYNKADAPEEVRHAIELRENKQ